MEMIGPIQYNEINPLIKKHLDKEVSDEKNDLKIIEISAKKNGMPSKQHEDIILLVSKDYAVVDNKRFELSKDKKQQIDNLMKDNYSKLNKIFEEQTPDFLSKHFPINNVSKIFILKLSNEEIRINYQTGTESDNKIKKLIEELKTIVFGKVCNHIDSNNTISKCEIDVDSIIDRLNKDCVDSVNVEFVLKLTNIIFNNFKGDDPFWTELSKDILNYIIIYLLQTNHQLKYDDIVKILIDKNKYMHVCKNANLKINDDKVIKITDNIKKSSDKMLESCYSILKGILLSVDLSEKIISYIIKFNDKLSFSINFIDKLGDLTHPNDTTFRIGNNITIMIARCDDIELLEIRANEWLKNSANLNNQTILEDFNKLYLLNDKIKVIEKAIIKDNKKRYYKFIYCNHSMIIFGYINKELSTNIDDAILSLKLLIKQKKIQRNPFEKPINCKICLTRNEFANKFYGYHLKNNINDEGKVLNYLDMITLYLNDYEFKSDKNFIFSGRKKIIYDEIINVLNGTQKEKESLYFVLGSLEEFMCNDNFIKPSNENYEDIRNKNCEYIKSGCICLEERKYIDNIINKIKKYIYNKISIPKSLSKFVSIDENGYVLINEKLSLELENEYNNFIVNYYTDKNNKIVNKIVDKIIKLPFNVETTIAQLINYNPDKFFVEPLIQGIISNAVKDLCKFRNIKIEESYDEVGGLAYFIKFKKMEIGSNSRIIEFEDLKKIIIDEAKNLDFNVSDKVDFVISIINKIKDLPLNVESTIGQLIGYNNSEKNVTDCETQGYILWIVYSVCESINIGLQLFNDVSVELPFNLHFLKYFDNKLPYSSCKYCGAPLKLEIYEDSHGGSKEFVCSKCGKNQENTILLCPICRERLMFMVPDGKILYCKKCNKNYKNNNGLVGEEVDNSYINDSDIKIDLIKD